MLCCSVLFYSKQFLFLWGMQSYIMVNEISFKISMVNCYQTLKTVHIIMLYCFYIISSISLLFVSLFCLGNLNHYSSSTLDIKAGWLFEKTYSEILVICGFLHSMIYLKKHMQDSNRKNFDSIVLLIIFWKKNEHFIRRTI